MSQLDNSDLQKVIRDVELTPLSHTMMIDNAIRLMELIGKSSTLSGQQKKQWVMDKLRQLITEHHENNEEMRASLLQSMDVVIPPMIDKLVSASQGDYQFAIATVTLTTRLLQYCLCKNTK